ncbi:hypothetical protein niasHS_005033 [Heterodera schachtii]|uniref:B30.2/SPRY domain-containing protein n=1 Tax=Heterodera schachtii TaxID=97005 RepID=A0ABD2JKC0_HETSC
MPSLTNTFSSADEFSPLQPILANLSTSEEMSVLIARIAELNRAKSVEPSAVASSDEVFGQDGNGSDGDEFSPDGEDGQKKEKRETQTNEAVEERLSQLQNDQKKLLEKISELEKQQKEQPKVIADQFSKILEKISELKKQQENTTKANSDQFSEMQNDKMNLLEMFIQFEKKQKQGKEHLNFRQNFWDANVCHEKLEIIGDKKLTVQKGNFNGWSSIFAKHSILLNNNSPDIFYYEISVKNKIGNFMSFGFAVKQQSKLEEIIRYGNGTYVYESAGGIYINGEGIGGNDKYSYGVGDTVGIGVNLSTRQISFTKNGLRLDCLFVDPHFADYSFYLYPFVSIYSFGDKIEANFGPNFKFDLAIL